MVYQSLFDKANEFGADYSKHGHLMGYEGCLDGVLSEVISITNKQDWNVEDILTLGFHSSRIVKGVVDFKIYHPNRSHMLRLVKRSIDAALKIYKYPHDSAESIQGLIELIKETGNQDVLSSKIKQPKDKKTLECTLYTPLSGRVANRLSNIYPKTILFIALGHGGVVAGMDTFLRYVDMNQNRASRFYTVRFSMRKIGDTEPQLSRNEIGYLQRLGKTRSRVVIFDEDVSSGKTITLAKHYFSNHVFPEHWKIETVWNAKGSGY